MGACSWFSCGCRWFWTVMGGCWWFWIVVDGCGWSYPNSYFSITQFSWYQEQWLMLILEKWSESFFFFVALKTVIFSFFILSFPLMASGYKRLNQQQKSCTAFFKVWHSRVMVFCELSGCDVLWNFFLFSDLSETKILCRVNIRWHNDISLKLYKLTFAPATKRRFLWFFHFLWEIPFFGKLGQKNKNQNFQFKMNFGT